MGGGCWGCGEGAVVGYCFGEEEGAEEEEEGFGSGWVLVFLDWDGMG